MVLCFAMGTYAIHSANEKSVKVCKRTEIRGAYILSSIDRSLKTLPTIAYYKTHPLELKAQLANIQKDRINFLPKPCDPGFLGLF